MADADLRSELEALRQQVRSLQDRQEIRDVVQDLYYYLLDTRDRSEARFDELAERCFSKDIVFEYPDGMRVQGLEELTRYRKALNENYYARVRDFGHCYIELDGDRARAWVTSSQATWNSEDGDPNHPDRVSYGSCHYAELRREPRGWRICRRVWQPIGPQKKPPTFVIDAAARAKSGGGDREKGPAQAPRTS